MVQLKRTTFLVLSSVTVLYLFLTYILQRHGRSQLDDKTSIQSNIKNAKRNSFKEVSQIETERGMGDDSSFKYQVPSNKVIKDVRNLNTTFQNAGLLISPCQVLGVTVNCSSLSLTNIHPDWFPNNTETILLNDNHLQTLTNDTFSHLVNLTSLDLSNNEIKCIEPNSFKGLTKLRKLDLHQNNINFSAVNNLSKFMKQMSNLKEINITQNNGIYNASFLNVLMSLEILSMDFDSTKLYFGSGFQRMKNLRFLQLSGNFTTIDEQSFENMYFLKELYFVGAKYLYSISHYAFKPLANLSVLSFRIIKISTQYVLSLLEPFQGRNMTELSIFNVRTETHNVDPMKEGYINANDTKYLLNICLNRLTLSANQIYYFTQDSMINLNTWNKCLLEITINDNQITGNIVTIFRILLIKNLQKVMLKNIMRTCSEFKAFPNSLSEERKKDKNETHLLSNFKLLDNIHSLNPIKFIKDTPTTVGRHDAAVLRISESIKYIDMRRFVGSQSMKYYVKLSGGQNLEYLDLSDSGFREFIGVMEGMPSLKTLILSGNDVSVLSNTYFDTFPALKNLALSQCRLDRNFIASESGRLFKNMPMLEQLDMSSNLLNYLSKDTFIYNTHLQYLFLSGNQFREIPFSLRNTPELRALDLSENSITTIDVSTMRELDFLVSRSGNFKLYLGGNVFSCGCNDLKFLKWMRSSLITFDQNGNFTCINKEGERSYTLKYSELDSLWRECWGQVFFYFALILLCLYAIGVFVVFILLKNKHFVMSYFLQTFGGFQLHTRQDYPIGVYIGYSDSDYQFPCNVLRQFIENSIQLNTFINDRDLIASVDKASGIVNAINASWRILLVCSESFLQDDEWSMFTIRSAIYTQSPANPARVVVLVHESCLPLLPPELLSSINDENILVVSDWSMNYKLTQMLRTRLA